MKGNRFDGKCVVVTGAGSGMGLEVARQFLAEGAHVVGADLNTKDIPIGCIPVVADVASPPDVQMIMTTALANFGSIDILCNNAGIGSTTDVIDCSLDEWERVFAINVRGTFLGMKYALPSMVQQRDGVVINWGSVLGLLGFRDRAAYGASKGAIIALTRQVAMQYASAGVRCNCICPGPVDTPWVTRILSQATDPIAARATFESAPPLGRIAQPSEVAAAVLFLSSREGSFCTGMTFVIDGGITAGTAGAEVAISRGSSGG